MSLPPTDISPSELFIRLMERPQPSAIVDYPAKSPGGAALAQIRILVLTGEQQEEARFKGKEYLRSTRKMTDQDVDGKLGEALLGDAVARECIARSCHMVDPIPNTEDSPQYPRLFPDAKSVSRLPADEITALFGAYCAVQKRLGPFAEDMGDGEVNAWIQRLEDGGSALPLSLLASHQVADLCLHLSARGAALSRLLISQRQSSPINWESIPDSWVIGTFSSSEPAVESSPSDDSRLVTQEEAIQAATAMAKLSR